MSIRARTPIPTRPQPVYSSGPRSAATATPPGQIQTAPLASEQAPSLGYGVPPTPSQASSEDELLAISHQPEKGELKIKERRTWKTWQVLTVAIIAAGIGMWFNGNAGSASGNPAASSGSSSYKLPPPSSSTAHAGSSTAAGASSSPTTTAASSTSTTAAGASPAGAAGTSDSTTTTGAASVGPATVLVPETQQTGNWTSPAFTIAGGTWNIGWAFQCAPAPAGGPSFQIFTVNAGGSPGSTPAVTSTAASGSAVTPQTTAGSQQVIVQTTAACRWAVKVTGSSS